MTPAQVANECEMLAFQQSDGGDREAAMLFMTPCNTIRSLLRTLERLNDRVHSGYDFNADPDSMTLEVGELLQKSEYFPHPESEEYRSFRYTVPDRSNAKRSDWP